MLGAVGGENTWMVWEEVIRGREAERMGGGRSGLGDRASEYVVEMLGFGDGSRLVLIDWFEGRRENPLRTLRPVIDLGLAFSSPTFIG